MSGSWGLALIVLAAAGTATGAAAGAEPARSAIDLGGLDTRSAALMLSAQEAGALEISALAIPLPDPGSPGTSEADSAGSLVTLVVDIGGASLLAGAPPPAAQSGGGHDSREGELITELYAYAIDADGGLVDSLTQAFRLALEQDRARLSAGGIKFFGNLELPAGHYSLRVLVLHRRSGRLGLRILPLVAPAWGPAPVLVAPFRRELTADWILVHAAGETPAFPVAIGTRNWVPATRRGLRAGAGADFLLAGRGLDRGVRAQLVDGDGQQPAAVGLGDLRPVSGGPAGLEMLAAELDGGDLGAGEYRLRISVADTVVADTVVADTVVADTVVADTVVADTVVANTVVAESVPLIVTPADDAPAEPAEPAGLSARVSRGRQAEFERLQEVRGGYRLALGRLASNDRAGALEPLIKIERRRIGTGAAEEQKRLLRAEVEVVREVAGADPRRLLSVIWLHEALYRRYHRQRRYLLATHSRQVISRLAELYLERDRSPRGRHLVACALVSLGGYLQQTGSLPAAENTYLQALAHDPAHPAALIGVAAIQESYGQYQAAVELLQRLHETRPADTHTRLRLGINLRRLDKPRKAAGHLLGALSQPGPEWIAAVAAQELASLHAGQRHLDEALRVLGEAVARHPQVQRLKIQLAALLDRAERGTEALATLDRLDPSASSGTDSPRLIYSRAPTTAITAARRALAEELEPPPARSAARPAGGTTIGDGS